MARLIKCPRCQSQVDVTNVSGGATVRCPDCGANLRVPTGQTGNYPKVNAAAPEPAAPSHKKQTGVFRKMAAQRGPGGTGGGRRMPRKQKSNTGLFVGLGVGALAIAIVLAAVMMSGGKKPNPNAGANTASNQGETPADTTPAPVIDNTPAPATPEKPKTPKRRTYTKGEVPVTFEPGARGWADRQTRELYVIKLEDDLKEEFNELATNGKVREIIENDSKWVPYIIDALLSDEKDIAWSAYQALHQICQKRNISSSEEGFRNPLKLENFNSSYVRGGEYVFWSEQWWAKPNNQDAVRSWAGGAEIVGRMVDPNKANWEELMRNLRAGGAFDDKDRPEGLAYMMVKGMGPAAYPKLIGYIVNEDPLLGRAAVAVLNELTGRQSPLPNATTNVTIKSQWESWYKREYPD